MTYLKIITLLVITPFILTGIVFGLLYHGFCAGMMYSEKLIEKAIER